MSVLRGGGKVAAAPQTIFKEDIKKRKQGGELEKDKKDMGVFSVRGQR